MICPISFWVPRLASKDSLEYDGCKTLMGTAEVIATNEHTL